MTYYTVCARPLFGDFMTVLENVVVDHSLVRTPAPFVLRGGFYRKWALR